MPWFPKEVVDKYPNVYGKDYVGGGSGVPAELKRKRWKRMYILLGAFFILLIALIVVVQFRLFEI